MQVLRVLHVARTGEHAVVDLGQEHTDIPVLCWQGELASSLSLEPGRHITLAVRAELITPCPIAEIQGDTPAPPGVLQLAATLRESRCEGPLWRLDCTLPWGMQAHAFALPEAVYRLNLQSGDVFGLRMRLQTVNAPTESFWGRLKTASLDGKKFASRREAMDAALDWMAFYNHRRLHSTLGYLSPMQYEQRWYEAKRKKAA